VACIKPIKTNGDNWLLKKMFSFYFQSKKAAK